ncbi:MAG: hypothetical protein KDA84_02150, partial [Planctomycetaceae bacterium]|nr:hypothetical protein [Planctomycetaceae bacterium]
TPQCSLPPLESTARRVQCSKPRRANTSSGGVWLKTEQHFRLGHLLPWDTLDGQTCHGARSTFWLFELFSLHGVTPQCSLPPPESTAQCVQCSKPGTADNSRSGKHCSHGLQIVSYRKSLISSCFL